MKKKIDFQNQKNKDFTLVSSFTPQGSQPSAIAALVKNIKAGMQFQTLLGVTGSGKTFTIAHTIARVKMPTLVLAHNKTLAAQLYTELKDFFPNNRVEYFVSYYDYYRPESYLPQKDQYIEKDAAINPILERMRMSTTSSLLSCSDVIVVASVSCIYGLGDPKNYRDLGLSLEVKMKITRNDLLVKLIAMQYERNDTDLAPGLFRVRGDTIDIIPGYAEHILRIALFGDEIECITEVDKLNRSIREEFTYTYLFPAKQFVVPEGEKERAVQSILSELDHVLPAIGDMEAHRLKKRTLYDLEMLQETGYCKGIENYSRHFDNRLVGQKPFCLLDYFPKNFFLVIDESHQTIPQLHAMYAGDQARKKSLIDYGFRLPSAYDNRPLCFEEFEKYMNNVVFVSATPSEYELKKSIAVVEQIIRPTGLVDPIIEIRPTEKQVSDMVVQIKEAIEKGNRTLVTTLTKKLAEELSEHLSAKGIKTRYLHSEIKTLERTELIRELRLGVFDVLVGINLLREGLDIPEVGLIGILDADKEGFLRDARSLIQTIGRAARNPDAKVILYADKMTKSIVQAAAETKRRRTMQLAYNKEHGITPEKIVKPIKEKVVAIKDTLSIPKAEIPNILIELEEQMKNAAEQLHFEEAIALRDRMKELQKRTL